MSPPHLTGKLDASLAVRATLVNSNKPPPTSVADCWLASLGFGIKRKCKLNTIWSSRNLSDSKAGNLQTRCDQEPDPEVTHLLEGVAQVELSHL